MRIMNACGTGKNIFTKVSMSNNIGVGIIIKIYRVDNSVYSNFKIFCKKTLPINFAAEGDIVYLAVIYKSAQLKISSRYVSLVHRLSFIGDLHVNIGF